MNVTGSLALPGFFLSGFLFALLGAILPVWGHHLDPQYAPAGRYFLCASAGVLLSAFSIRNLAPAARVRTVLTVSCALACAALLFLSVAGPPASLYWRFCGWVAVGLAGGLLNAALFEAIRPLYQAGPAATVTTGGVYFGLGCLASALLVAGTFYLYSVTLVLAACALIPALFSLLYYRRFQPEPRMTGGAPPASVFRDFVTPGAVMFALLLFFQSGAEWTLAGWLPLYLIRRLGLSPATAVWMLALYWFTLLTGRAAAVYLLTAIRHSRLLLSCAASALFGCLLLLSTVNQLGAVAGTLFCAAGFAMIFPLVLERIGHRFPYYHPGVFNSIFSLALAGGMLAPWTVGWLADVFGIWVVMGLPVLSTLMVVVLLLLIWLESKVTGR